MLAGDQVVAAVAGGHQDDAAQRRRLRWRSRRGLLENDLIITRFLDAQELMLSDQDVSGLHMLLDLPDNELLELILCRKEPEGELAAPEPLRVLEMLRNA